MKREAFLPVYVNMVHARLFLTGMRVTRDACFVMAALIYVLMTGVLLADTHYVSATRPDDSGNGLSWATAEKTIQAAVTAATAGDTIIVTNGVYAPISTANKAITIQSVNGAAVTIIDGGGTNRCATLGSSFSHTNTVLAGITLRNGSASDGGGSYFGTLNNCTLTGNSAYYGGGSYLGTLNNCTLSGNSASYGGGSSFGTLNNCTLTGNSVFISGGGTFYGTLKNCIVWGNTSSGAPGNYEGGTISYSCALPLPPGTGNLSADPLFRLPAVGDYCLSPGSPCLNAGTNGYVFGSMDGFGKPRIQNGTVDMGAYEGARTLLMDAPYLARNVSAGGASDGILISWEPPSAGGAVLYRVCRLDMATGQWMPISGWITERNFLDTRVFLGVIARYAIYSAFDAQLGVISGLSVPVEGQRAQPQYYVDVSRPDDSGDGKSWLTAKKTIQAAIVVATPYDTILVTNGVYAPITTTNNLITIRSVNGSDGTVIDGGGTNRCATLGSASDHVNTILVGFTLRNGYASSGGGSYCGTLNNCTVMQNSVSSFGGGSCYGTLNNCTVMQNSAAYSGGGAYNGTLNNCTLAGNWASSGGGSYYGTLRNCIVWGNTLASGVTNNYVGGTYSYSCTEPLTPGTGNRSSAPLFRLPAAWDFRLSPGSPCLNSGTNGYTVGAVDLLGNTRIQDGTVDMGACEGLWTLATDTPHLARNVLATGGADGILVSWEPPSAGGAVLYSVCRLDMTTGQWMPVSGWITELSFLDMRVFGGVTNCYAIVSAFDARLDVISGLSATAEGQRTLPQYYVDESRPNDEGDGRSWTTAKKTIQAAIVLSVPYDTILVTNGVYAPISTTNKIIAILSVNGSAVTIIDGGGTNRCATMGSASSHLNTSLIGFTLRKGKASYGGGSCYGTLINCTLAGNTASSGGGAYYGTLNNCTLEGNSASTDGGGSCYSTLNNCTLEGNTASNSGGGSRFGTLNTCTLTKNRSSSFGGGSSGGILNNCTFTGNSAINGGGSNGSTLNNCTLEGNNASSYGGGARDSTLNNCTLMWNYASSVGGGASGGTLNNCTLVWNSASSSGGGAGGSTLNNCTLTGNSASDYGGGAYYGTLNNCTLSGNASYDGGGAYWGRLNNCTLTGNRASYGGGVSDCTLNNCTLTGNSASSSGGGSDGGTLNNCIIWGNTFVSGVTNNYSSGTFLYSCTTPLPSGMGNISVDPLFRLPVAGDYRLSLESPCLNVGTNGYAVGAVDVLGNPRIQEGTVDIGAYEGPGTLVTNALWLAHTVLATGMADGIAVSWKPPSVGGAVLYRVCRMDMETGQWTPVSDWIDGLSFLDTRVFCGVTYRYIIVSAFDSRLDVISGLSASAEGQRTLPQLYVDASRPNDDGDGRSWATAKRNIQAAIGVAAPYDTILVTNGVYAPISTGNEAIAIQSVNGADVTVIDGGGTNRCATLFSESILKTILVGFTLRNGFHAYFGGGAYFGAMNNCNLTGNSATYGGGAYNAALNNCTLTGNTANYGGGASGGVMTLNNCTLTGNSASSDGGGSYYGKLNNCVVWGNTLVSGVTNNYSNSSFGYSCTTPLPSGSGNISNDPLFKDSINSNFMLRVGSPCINAGSNPFVVGETDLAGNPRIAAGTVDMGAYEMPSAVTVTFDANGGLLATGQTSTNFVVYTGDFYDSCLTLINGISRLGYTFVAWWTGDNGTGTQVTETNIVSTAANHTLYAAWTANTYTLTLNAAGGSVSPSSKGVTFDTAYGDLPMPERGGYRFEGWWTGVGGTGAQVTGATRVTPAGDHTLYATWTEDPYLCAAQGAEPLSSAGYYEGFFYNKTDFDGTPVAAVRGTLSLALSAMTGKLTAKVIVNKGSLRFRQSAWAFPGPDDDGVRRAVLTASSGEVLGLYVAQDRIWGTLSGGSLGNGAFELDGARNRFLDQADVPAQALLDSFRGYYTVALPVYGALSLGEANAAPKGTGYLTITVGNHGDVRIAGALADGTRFSRSSHLILFDGCGPEACVPLFVPLYGRTGWVGGLLWLDPVSRTVVTDRDLGWFVRWEKPASGVDGFSELLDACGGFYSTIDSLAAHYRFNAQTNIVTYVHSRGIETIEPVFPSNIAVIVDGTRLTMIGGIKPIRTGDVYDYAASENSSMATLTFQPATGIFKGGFKLYYDYTMINTLQHKVVSVLYSGVLTPMRSTVFDGLPAGQGYYLVPDNAPAVAPYRLKRSYRIELDAEEL